jgi:condensin complex subunit 3
LTVSQTFEENSTLEGILGELIVPAVKRKELVLREKGLVCLGLCCLIARRMALNSFQLFLSQVQTAPEVLKLRVLQVVFDVLMVHEGDFLANASVGVRRVILCGSLPMN